MSAQYVIGIDLGTTNSVLAYARLGEEQPTVEILPIPQLVAGGVVESRSVLPSFLYLGTPADRAAKNLELPWAAGRDFAVGEIARRQAAETPDRTVAAAKSWLAHSRVDRRQPLLPYGAPPEVPKVSPVEATRRYFEHIAAAWRQAMPDAPLADQQVVLTVPASFDVSARELTREAALTAGLPTELVLLEEPQAALYAWLSAMGDRWRRQLQVGDTLLVCDVGGGTSDFTLIGVSEEAGQLVLKRLAVGNHILVGGDNMDLALAHATSAAFAEKGVQLDPWQSVALWHSCRAAKEALLGSDGPKKHPVTILGRGSRLIGGTVTVDLLKETVEQSIVNGFFPVCKLDEKPSRRRASGFAELGLPFESDTAITRHLAAFLSAQAAGGAAPRPTHLLFNGGVFKAPALRQRLTETVASWFPKQAPPQGLEANDDLDLAVARGAAYYGLVKQGRGVRIRGGTARAYYVGIESAGLAIPGAPRPLRALCVAPFGMEEGTEVDVPGEPIGLVVGEDATFRFFSSPVRRDDKPGDLIARWSEDEIAETDSLEASLPADEAEADEDYVPVRFVTRITELGMFELWCASIRDEQRWKLEFSVRQDAEES